MVGSTVDWDEDTKICPGPPQMAKCVKDQVGMIGYVDSGLGHDEDLGEVALKVEGFTSQDFFLTSAQALQKGGVLSALDEEEANIPDSADADWSGVDLINQVKVSPTFKGNQLDKHLIACLACISNCI